MLSKTPDTPDPQELADWLRLTLIPGIGSESQRKLLAALGLPEQIFAASPAQWREVIGPRAERLLALDDAAEAEIEAAIEAALFWAAQPAQHIITLADPRYPPALLQTADPPILLYVRGRVELLSQPSLAMVGSRNATPQGLKTAEDFAATLAQTGLCIVSGLALGIDAAAHRGALRAGGSTVAVIGTGADRLYPARNQSLARQIIECGAIISEFPLGTPAAASNFPRRNRIISGLARGVLVIEAAPESGSLISARLAGEQGREVFAIPGSIHSPLSRGCHQLIRQGAKLVESAQDVLEELGEWSQQPVVAAPAAIPTMPPPLRAARAVQTRQAAATAPAESLPALAPGPEADLLASLGHDPCSLDELALRSSLTAEALLAMLMALELEGRVAVLPGNRYQRLSA